MATTLSNTDFERSDEGGSTKNISLLENTLDDKVVTNVIPVEQDINPGLKDVNVIMPNQSLIEFLKRPMLVSTGVLQSTNAIGTVLVNNDAFAPLTAFPLFSEKLNGFGGIRAKTKITLQVNAQRFQQGLYILAYIPCYSDYPNQQSERLLDLCTVVQLPHVELDLNCDTEATLEIPYSHPLLYYDWTNGSPGNYFVICYSPVSSGTGSLQCSYTLWVSYEDVSLYAPTVRRAILQAGTMEDNGGASASRIMRNVSNAFNEVAQIPILKSVATPASWVTGIASKTLASMGWSKATETRPVTMVQAQTATNLINADGPTAAMPLGLFETNEVERLNSFGYSGVDEMSFKHILQHKAYINRFTWSDSAGPDTSIFSSPVCPRSYDRVIGPRTYLSPMGALARYFLYWRGSICFRFKIVKTEMHSGRLSVAFAPGQTSNAAMTLQNTAYLLRNIIDIREGSEFTMCIPFVNAKSWIQVDESIGMLDVRVLNQLRAPSTCAQSVTVVFEVFGGDDMKFAVPFDMTYVPYMQNLAFALRASDQPEHGSSGDSEVGEEPEELIPTATLQGGPEEACSLYEGGIGGSSIRKSIDPSALCIGEEIQSVKQAINTVSWFVSKDSVAAVFVSPFAWGARSEIGGSGISDCMSFWASMYAFSRGGVDLHIIPSNDGLISVAYTASFSDFPIISFGSGGGFGAGPRTTFETTTKKRMLQIRTPQYLNMHSRLNYLYASNETGVGPKPLECRMMAKMVFHSTAEHVLVGRSGSDDFQFGFFLGVFPMRAA